MRTWDPLSIFKYLTGAPSMHVVMLINYFLTAKYHNQCGTEDAPETEYLKWFGGSFEICEEYVTQKQTLIKAMYIAHAIAAASHLIFETGVAELLICKRQSMVVPVYSLFLQIICYQGLIIFEADYFYYQLIKVINEPNNGYNEQVEGIFAAFDRWDLLIMIDIVIFLSTILTLLLFILGMVNPGKYFIEMFKKDDDEFEEKDFMEANLLAKKMLISINSMTITAIIYLVLLNIDVKQKDVKFMWFLLVTEGFVFLATWSNEFIIKMAKWVYGFKVVISLGWALQIISTHSLSNSEDEHFIAVGFVQYVFINELLVWPMWWFRSYLQSKTLSINEKEFAKAKAKSQMKNSFSNMLSSKSSDKFKSMGNLNSSLVADDKKDENKEDEADGKVQKQLNIEDSIYCLTFTSMISEINVHYELGPYLNDYFFKCTMVFFIQMTIILLIGLAAYNNTDGSDYEHPYPTNMALRLLCCYLFHLSNYADVADSYRRLKFLVNNPNKFEQKHYLPAFLITQYQFSASFLVEAINLLFLTRQGSLIDLIMNYVAFEGVSQIDNLYTASVRNFKAADLIPNDAIPNEKLDELRSFKKQSSKEAVERFSFNRPVPETQQVEPFNKIVMMYARFIYQVEKYLYKGVYFYMMPYLIVPLSYYVYSYNDM